MTRRTRTNSGRHYALSGRDESASSYICDARITEVAFVSWLRLANVWLTSYSHVPRDLQAKKKQ